MTGNKTSARSGVEIIFCVSVNEFDRVGEFGL